MSKQSQDQYTRCGLSQIEKKEKKYIKSSLHPSICTLPLTKISYTNSPLNYDYSLNENNSPLFVTSDKG